MSNRKRSVGRPPLQKVREKGMNAQELYEEMKTAADYFGVGFHGFHMIQVEFEEGRVIFSLGDSSITRKAQNSSEG